MTQIFLSHSSRDKDVARRLANDLQREGFEVWFDEWEHAGAPWEAPEAYARFSPHRYAKDFKTPTLVTCGELDFRVPYTQSLEFYTALQRQGVPSKLIVFPDEGHWILKPQDSVVWYDEVLAWIKTYLNGGATTTQQ